MTVLILSDEGDEHALHVASCLQTRGVPVKFLNSEDFPARCRLVLHPQPWDGALLLPGGERLPFGEIRSVYWRTLAGFSTTVLPDPEQTLIAENDTRSLFESLLMELPVRWVNGWEAYQLHQRKPAALARVARLGVPVPDTLFGNDAEAIVQFAQKHPRCIFKPVQGGAFTERLTPDHLTPENLQSLTLAPVTLQEEVQGQDVRVFVAGEEVLACEIHSHSLDYREDPDPKIVPLQLPEQVRRQCLAIARTLHLLWTGMDFRRREDGTYVFLEANPSPMFLGFQQRSGLPLDEHLVRLLLGE